MVRSAVHRAHTVEPSRKTAGDSSLEQALSISIVVDALEECECLRVRRGLGGEISTKILHRDVAMADNIATSQRLRCRVVCVRWVSERASLQIRDLNLDVELGVGFQIVSWSWEEDNARNHVVVGRDVTHHHTIAGASSDLGSVGQGLASTEVDEVCRVTNNWSGYAHNLYQRHLRSGIRLASVHIRRANRIASSLDI